ncbi:hypothetical protein F7725_009183 [Dissostichus mawsoni]|uniref:C-type lectin domain-containing protein n=1 Tax=Dissostichus mawsoni TaxID=36200 RepID=A0A7J5Z6A4_DISMA|nr:hypothetical protein F7725_009183 [Dissostichus mawsoni]
MMDSMWFWMSGTSVNYSYWKTHSPSQISSPCGGVNTSDPFHWTDFPCGDHLYFICLTGCHPSIYLTSICCPSLSSPLPPPVSSSSSLITALMESKQGHLFLPSFSPSFLSLCLNKHMDGSSSLNLLTSPPLPPPSCLSPSHIWLCISMQRRRNNNIPSCASHFLHHSALHFCLCFFL